MQHMLEEQQRIIAVCAAAVGRHGPSQGTGTERVQLQQRVK